MPTVEYQPLPETSFYVSYVEAVPGSLYVNTQNAGTTDVDSCVPTDSNVAFNGWPPPGLPIEPSPPSVPSIVVEHSLQYAESPSLPPSVPSTSVPSVPAVASVPVVASTAVVPAVPSVPVVVSTAVVPAVPSLPVVASTAVESSATPTNMEAKKVAKGKLGKKRTHSVAVAPMLMTNKKVSSLVNKWKQAKEELHGSDEDEDEKALYDLEMLERKRQKEIEQWHRQQIASGEALDNANFQPLGTLDWRERVKRAKKADMKEGEIHAKSPTLVLESQKESPPKKPDLIELSKGLPSGWQAFWDETSSEVYYGNLATQETSWDRPVT